MSMPDSEKKIRILVYGTLRRGGMAAHFLQKFRLVSHSVSIAGFQLFDGGWYPFAIRAPKENRIIGDIFEIPESYLAVLDEYEGGEYERFFLEEEQVYIYLKKESKVKGLVQVVQGDWLKYWRQKHS